MKDSTTERKKTNYVHKLIVTDSGDQAVVKYLQETLRQTLAKLPVRTSICYIVGGFVRDTILGLETGDIDLVVSTSFFASFTKMLEVVADELGYEHKSSQHKLRNPVCANHTLKQLSIKIGSKTFSIDLRELRDVIAGDAVRRDFTCNALYADVDTLVIQDPLGGLDHLKNKQLVGCAEPKEVFKQGIRLLRAVRMESHCRLHMNPGLLDGLKQMANEEELFNGLNNAFNEEFQRLLLLKGKAKYRALVRAVDTGLIQRVPFRISSWWTKFEPVCYYQEMSRTFARMAGLEELILFLPCQGYEDMTIQDIIKVIIVFLFLLNFTNESKGSDIRKPCSIIFKISNPRLGFFSELVELLLAIMNFDEQTGDITYLEEKMLSQVPERLLFIFFLCRKRPERVLQSAMQVAVNGFSKYEKKDEYIKALSKITSVLEAKDGEHESTRKETKRKMEAKEANSVSTDVTN